MKKILASLLFSSYYLFAQIDLPKELTDNDFEAYEFQMFVTNTKDIPITSQMTSKLIFEGSASDYYDKFSEMNKKRFNTTEELTKRVFENGTSYRLADAAYYKDIKSLENFGIGVIGSITLNAILKPILGDKTYVQVQDFYENDQKVTRVIKYLVSDDGLDEDDYQLVFKTTNSDSYHFRSGAITNITQRTW